MTAAPAGFCCAAQGASCAEDRDNPDPQEKREPFSPSEASRRRQDCRFRSRRWAWIDPWPNIRLRLDRTNLTQRPKEKPAVPDLFASLRLCVRSLSKQFLDRLHVVIRQRQRAVLRSRQVVVRVE